MRQWVKHLWHLTSCYKQNYEDANRFNQQSFLTVDALHYESPPTGAEIDVFQSELSVMVEIITKIVDLVLLM